VSPTPDKTEALRAAEIIATVYLATDLGMGFPFEHGFRATLMADRLCEVLGVDSDISEQVYYASMLMYSGCTSEWPWGSSSSAASGQRH
jgi:hypothetical protein